MKLDQQKFYIYGCSGGSDSMAVLDMLRRKKLHLIVAHINYHVRESADRDQNLVMEYCHDHKLLLEILRAPEKAEGNFEAWAREVRYQFFKKLVYKYKAEGIIVAHQKDDLLETYLLQKRSKKIPMYWGLKEESTYEEVKLFRPYLDKTKQEMEEYCANHHIVYGEDETNLDLRYQRNRIRHQILKNMTLNEKEVLLEEIKEENKKLTVFYMKVRKAEVACFEPFNQKKYKETDEAIRLEALRSVLYERGIDSRHFTIAHLKELDHILLSNRNVMKDYGEKIFSFAYGRFDVYNPPKKFHQTFNTLEYGVFDGFQLLETGTDLYGVTVTESDFPLTVRNVEESDEILLRFGRKKLARWFIDRKIPPVQRMSWPVLVNAQNEVILFPGIGCNLSHYTNKHNLFMLK